MAKYFSPNIIGIDEVGRGAWAGPIVAAAVVFFDRTRIKNSIVIRDSKKMSSSQRDEAAFFIAQHAIWGIGSASSQFIDREGIQAANRLIFQRALEKVLNKIKLSCPSTEIDRFSIQIDGRKICEFSLPYTFIVNGDDTHTAIAAASIVAKVTRDNIMRRIGDKFPAYLLEKNKGYGTDGHYQALLKQGATEFHRKSYAPIQAIINNVQE